MLTTDDDGRSGLAQSRPGGPKLVQSHTRAHNKNLNIHTPLPLEISRTFFYETHKDPYTNSQIPKSTGSCKAFKFEAIRP